MYVILTYDVAAKRNAKVLKICRKYLLHVQKSVFEGFLNDKQLASLKYSIAKLIDTDSDQIAIYKGIGGKFEKDIIGYHISNDNII